MSDLLLLFLSPFTYDLSSSTIYLRKLSCENGCTKKTRPMHYYLTKLKVTRGNEENQKYSRIQIFECNLIVCWILVVVVVVSSFKEQTHITPSINYYQEFLISRPYCIRLQFRLFLNLYETCTANLILLSMYQTHQTSKQV